MRTVTSKDGTSIAFDQTGTGPALILAHGAFTHRAIDPQAAQLADLLSPHFTVFHYDRRGRGDSGDTQPYTVQREVEDLEALIDEAGGSAFVYGISSGAALAMHAAIELGGKIKKLAMYEAPYYGGEAARQKWEQYRRDLNELLAADRRSDAAALFLTLVGMPADQLAEMRREPWWAAFEAVAPTLAYDAAVLGEDRSVPTGEAAKVVVPALVMNGSASEGFMYDTAMALAKAIPNAQHRTLEGQTHAVEPEAIAPVLVDFFAA
ncbi:MAG TPA: alpha/beta hydrolase [Anaerolineales bacterium]|nr:alpha/beta hydrolase [Anaerolineales bacterium]